MTTLQLSEIWIYPIKSLGGISLLSAKLRPKGFEYDRRWMLVDKEGRFLTQRDHPPMVHFKPMLQEDGLLIQHKHERIIIPFTSQGPSLQVQIWDDVVGAVEVSEQHSQWFTRLMGIDCKLMFFPEDNPRAVDPDYSVNNDNTSLSDAFPYLIIGQSSLDHLNMQLQDPVPINRFRPNLVFTGGDPHEEDTWKDFTIGSSIFRAVKKCARCVMTTINHETGDKSIEPLRTMASYRTSNGKVHFGMNLILLNGDSVAVGDRILVE